ncbi:MAG: hypothetical protein EXR73_13105 [Myxococcales bacterium]|nr:hypothetical protein [Myxococcales bacterium]
MSHVMTTPTTPTTPTRVRTLLFFALLAAGLFGLGGGAAEARSTGWRVAKKEQAQRLSEGGKANLVRGAIVYQRPSRKADELFELERGTEVEVLVVAEDGDWARVQDSDGAKGWVEARHLAAPKRAVRGRRGRDRDRDVEREREEEEEEEEEDDGEEEGDEGAKAGAGGLRVAANVGFGMLARTTSYSSMGDGIRANYGIVSRTPAARVGVLGGKRMNEQITVGAEASFVKTVGGDGISVPEDASGVGMGDGDTLAWAAQVIDVRGTVGYDVSDGEYQLVGRVGYHLAKTDVAESAVAKLPSEDVAGFTVGAGIAAPRLADRIQGQLGVELLMKGALTQTEGMRDGETSAVKAWYATAVVTYAYEGKIDLFANYQLALETVTFEGANEREPSALNASREDLQHVLTVGGLYRF